MDAAGLLASSFLFGSPSAFATQRLTRIYRKRDPLPADVYVKVQNVVPTIGLNGIYLVVVRNVYDVSSTSQNTVSEGEALAERIAKLEQRDPGTATALRHAGQIVKSETLAARVEAVRS